mmetsp:Transcript_45301/g.124689  ORF Transcript_45301/g.124689 Transcript_45301/m.124689 type:complete len:134 (-) Transcript_45301:1153-1554(-)
MARPWAIAAAVCLLAGPCTAWSRGAASPATRSHRGWLHRGAASKPPRGLVAMAEGPSGLLIGAAETSAAPVTTPDLKSLGMPRVHRYARDDGEEWVMWFQGRDDDIAEEVVSLSTGRIFRATSNDGLRWEIEK